LLSDGSLPRKLDENLIEVAAIPWLVDDLREIALKDAIWLRYARWKCIIVKSLDAHAILIFNDKSNWKGACI